MNESSKIEGVVEVDFKNDTGEAITGKTVYYTEPLDPDRGEGRFAGKLFFSSAPPSSLLLILTPLWGRWCSFCMIELVASRRLPSSTTTRLYDSTNGSSRAS